MKQTEYQMVEGLIYSLLSMRENLTRCDMFRDAVAEEAASPIDLSHVTQIAVIRDAGDGSGRYCARQADLAGAYMARVQSETVLAGLQAEQLREVFGLLDGLRGPLAAYAERRAESLRGTGAELQRVIDGYAERCEAEAAEAARHTPAALEARISELEAQLSALETGRAAKGKAGKE